ncbi:MAG TPA: EamA family transporter [Firmicutes bacterium]|jgi:drug/metabolite transporter (DMT)-like permease|nr:EamA family transporter [Bacillota bacterium]
MQSLLGIFYLFGAFVLAGTSVIAGRFVIHILGTFTIAAGSLLFALIGLLPFCGRKLRANLRQISRYEWLGMLLQALFGIFLFRMFLLQGLIRTSTAEAGILTGVTPAATALLAWLILKEPINGVRILGVFSTVSGILVIQGLCSMNIGFSKIHFAGNLLVICAALCESLFNVLSRITSIRATTLQSRVKDPVVKTVLVVGIALLLCVGPALWEHPVQSLKLLDLTGWGALIWYGLFVTAVAFIFWYAGIKRCDASVAAAFTGMMPLTSLGLSVLLLHEQPGLWQGFGGLLVILGMLLTGLKSSRWHI